MTIDTKRLETDAEYWDECGAPDDAKYYVPESEDYFEGWLRPYPDNRNDGMQFKHINGDKWINNSCADKNCIPRPTKPAAPEWDGEGLPPEGADLEYDTRLGNWCPAKCIARGHDHSDPVAVIQTTNRIFIVSDSNRVRIRRTKRQRIGDALAEIIAKEIEIEFIDGNFHIETSSAIDYILSEYNLEPKQ